MGRPVEARASAFVAHPPHLPGKLRAQQHRTEAAGWRRAHLLAWLALCLALAGPFALCDPLKDVGQSHNQNLNQIGSSRPLRALNTSDSREAEQVSLLASKLEQWLACNRLRLAPVQLAEAGSWQPAGCAAHFDGRLCWPGAGESEELKLACPRANWLPYEQAPSIKSVINSIQSPHLSALELVATTNDRQSSATANNTESIGQLGPEVGHHQLTGPKEALARRLCTAKQPAPETGNLMLARATWQPEADYSACDLAAQDQWINLSQKVDEQLFATLVDQLERVEPAIDPYGDPDLLEQWILCIGNIMRQSNSPTTTSQTGTGDPWCPIIFDGWRCWPSTRAGEIAYTGCPRNQPGFSAERMAHKICTPDGTWYRHPMTNRFWSNYTTCVDTVDLAFRTKILNLYVIGNFISLVALSASLIIFISFKSLNCTRVTIHKNLFLSFITNNLMWIIWYTCVVNDANLLQSNPIECQLWHILLHYFLVSNYFWMFCEGLYLHTLLVVAFVSEDKILKWFYLLGWLTPVPITVAYAYNRAYDDYYTNFCWMEESPYNLILMAPIGISLLLNLIFLINIVRVLVTKLRANNSPDTHQTRKAVRATLILIPLLGLHYILTPFRPEAKSPWEGIYESVAAVCTSFQGLCVAMLFCFCNGEVIAVIKKKLKDTFNLSHGRPPNDLMRSRSNTLATTCALTSVNLNGNSQALAAAISDRFDIAKQPYNHSDGPQIRPVGRASNCSSLITTVTCNSGSSPVQTAAMTCLSTSHESGPLLSQQVPASAIAAQADRLDARLSIEKTFQGQEEIVSLLHNRGRQHALTTSFSVST